MQDSMPTLDTPFVLTAHPGGGTARLAEWPANVSSTRQTERELSRGEEGQ
ncbi:hypothetical protein [Thiocystis minor]|nr:hypothetical protein [Thiocystis minor]